MHTVHKNHFKWLVNSLSIATPQQPHDYRFNSKIFSLGNYNINVAILSCIILKFIHVVYIIDVVAVYPKIYMDFMVFGAPTKFLSMKISHLTVVT